MKTLSSFIVLFFLFIAVHLRAAQYPLELGEDLSGIEKRLFSRMQTSSSKDAFASYIRFLNYQNRSDEALQILRELKGEDNDPEKTLLWCELKYYNGDTENLRELAESITRENKSAWIASRDLLIRLDFLEGRLEQCGENCLAVIKADPGNLNAFLFQAQIFIRYGRYNDALETLEQAEVLHPKDLSILETRARVWDALGRFEDSKNLRRSIILMIENDTPKTPEGLVMASSAMRHLNEFRAANQCLQLAFKYFPADPFVLFEKIRLFRSTSGFRDSIVTIKYLLERHEKCPMAYFEAAEILWQTRKPINQVMGICKKALIMDPALIEARNRLILCRIVKGEWEAATALIEKNKTINPDHQQNPQLENILNLLRKGVKKTDDPEAQNLVKESEISSFLLMGEILISRGDFAGGRGWFKLALEKEPANLQALRGAGETYLRLGDFSGAYLLLKELFSKNRYDLQTKNMLELLASFEKGEILQSAPNAPVSIRIGYQPEDAALAEYALFLSQRYLGNLKKRYTISPEKPVHLQILSSRGDLPAAEAGLAAFGCGYSSPGVLGFLSYDANLFLLSPKAAGGLDERYRFDETLYRGLSYIALETIHKGFAHLWIKEGVSRYLTYEYIPDTVPFDLDRMIDILKGKNPPSFASLDKSNLPEIHILNRVYSWLILRQWVEKYGFADIKILLSRIGENEDWKSAATSVLKISPDELESETHAGILSRYPEFKTSRSLSFNSLPYLIEKARYNDDAKIELAKNYLFAKRFDDALKTLSPITDGENPSASAMFVAGRAFRESGNFKMARQYIQTALELEKMLKQDSATAEDYEALGFALLELGEKESALEAFRNSIRRNPFDSRKHGAFGKCLEILGTQNPKLEEYFRLLELRLPARTNDIDIRLDLAKRYMALEKERGAFQILRSSAGINPNLVSIHRLLAPLAFKLGDIEQSYESYRMILVKNKNDAFALEGLKQCEEKLGIPQQDAK